VRFSRAAHQHNTLNVQRWDEIISNLLDKKAFPIMGRFVADRIFDRIQRVGGSVSKIHQEIPCRR
jgi:hypothetical protein